MTFQLAKFCRVTKNMFYYVLYHSNLLNYICQSRLKLKLRNVWIDLSFSTVMLSNWNLDLCSITGRCIFLIFSYQGQAILWLCTLATTDVIPSDAKLEGPEKAQIQTVQLLLLYLDEHTLLWKMCWKTYINLQDWEVINSGHSFIISWFDKCSLSRNRLRYIQMK